ncbi:MAG: PspC domain-containing protein [Flavobacteriales bacterium]
MKKTLTANISGTVFHIEEDAFEALNRYLGNIRGRFAGTAGREDIMADIEARVAELFHERLDGRRQVVSTADVEHVVGIMGQPEDFVDEESRSERTGSSAEPYTAAPGKRRFFRDSEDKWLGGILGGLGAYIGVDPLWLRIGTIALVLASVGVLIPIYILLWILVPRAETATDRLQMRGEPVTVENIKRVVEEGAEKLKQGGERLANEASSLGRDWQSGAAGRKSRAVEIILKLVGIALIITAFSMLIGLVTGLIGGSVSLWHATWSNEDLGILDLGALLFNSPEQALWMAIGCITLITIPILGLFLSGFRLLTGTRTPRWLGFSMLLIWLAAWIPVTYSGVALGKDFKRSNSVLTEIELIQPASGMLYLDSMEPTNASGDWSIDYNDGDLNVDLDGLHLENGLVQGGWARLDIERSADSLFHLKVEREARGATAKTALNRAANIQFSYAQEADVLHVSPVIAYATSDKFRGQDVHFTLEVPEGKSIYLRPGSKHVIYDIDNVTNTYDNDMLGRTWTMTSRGLEDLHAPKTTPEVPTLPTDTIKVKTGPVAAVVWTKPAKRKSGVRPYQPNPVQSKRSAQVTAAQHHAELVVPNILGLFFQRLHHR